MVICLERGADLHTAQLMPLPLTVFCFSKIHTGFYLSGTGSPRKRAIKRVYVCACSEIIQLKLYDNTKLRTAFWREKLNELRLTVALLTMDTSCNRHASKRIRKQTVAWELS